MFLYKYDRETREYLGYFEAYTDPLESLIQGKEVYVYPPCSTDIIPPKLREGFIPVFNEEEMKWEEVENNRGLVIWNKDGKSFILSALGPVPEGYTLEKPVTLKELKEEKVKEINELYNKEYEAPIKLHKVEIAINDTALLRNRLEAFREFGCINYKDVDLSVEEAEEIIKFLYIRSMLLPKKKKELMEEVMLLKDKEEVKNFSIDFNLNMEEYTGLLTEELREKFSK